VRSIEPLSRTHVPAAPALALSPVLESRNAVQERVRSVPAAEIVPVKAEWLWPKRVPKATLTLLAGDPGLGKSLLSIDLAARLSRGELGDPGVTLIATAEDLPAATVVPRLVAAGADLARVRVVDGLRALPRDVDALSRDAMTAGASLVVIDPLMAFLPPGEVDAHKEQSVRVALARLQEMAEATEAAVLLVAHLNKGLEVEPLRRIAGSVGLQAAARSVLLLGRDPGDPESERGSQRVLVHVKSSLGELQPSLRYTVEPLAIGSERIETARIVARGPSAVGASELLAPSPEPGSAMAEATKLLQTELADGPKAARVLFAAADDVGVSRETLKRAKKRLGVESVKLDFSGGWAWKLPSREETIEAA
jgi:putative DNA primase/helicase